MGRDSEQLLLLVPKALKQVLKYRAKQEGTSMSWLATDALSKYLGVTPAELRGYEIPKRFADRKGNWTPNKRKGGDVHVDTVGNNQEQK